MLYTGCHRPSILRSTLSYVFRAFGQYNAPYLQQKFIKHALRRRRRSSFGNLAVHQLAPGSRVSRRAPQGARPITQLFAADTGTSVGRNNPRQHYHHQVSTARHHQAARKIVKSKWVLQTVSLQPPRNTDEPARLHTGRGPAAPRCSTPSSPLTKSRRPQPPQSSGPTPSTQGRPWAQNRARSSHDPPHRRACRVKMLPAATAAGETQGRKDREGLCDHEGRKIPGALRGRRGRRGAVARLSHRLAPKHSATPGPHAHQKRLRASASARPSNCARGRGRRQAHPRNQHTSSGRPPAPEASKTSQGLYTRSAQVRSRQLRPEEKWNG
ncbi:hypothetical protein NDU88_004036 [Pleurodeles waltl]|uniref:Uncharacterized protein n=1 Tax=Pleurodeles waltl TaxID=8319 RepID=A0AAV7W3U3_PLEWA|nr:hypothetical protein NDU88_004036 [Pleurodeles waltl]